MIRVLPPHIASQIAAGEVVQRPASVVKELLENAVDSGATRIDLVLEDAGSTLMQVADNGCGMSPQDALLAFERHATSKISDIEDIHRIHTFGFRGEALASIASVAHVQVRTRRAEDEVGTLVEIAGSAVTANEDVACSVGTVMSVRNLFFNMPARRKFLKSDAAELKHIVDEFQRVALCHPECTFTCTNNGTRLFHLPAGDNLRQRIIQAMGKELTNQLVEVNVETSMVRIKGYISRPQDARKATQLRFFFINNRYFKSPLLHKAVLNGYEKLLPEGRIPLYFIYLEADPETIDVNVHPAKTEVKFQDEQVLFQVLQAVIRESLGKFAFAPSIDFDTDGSQHDIPLPLRRGTYVHPPQPTYDPLFNPFRETPSAEAEGAGGAAGAGSAAGGYATAGAAGFPTSAGAAGFPGAAGANAYATHAPATGDFPQIPAGSGFPTASGAAGFPSSAGASGFPTSAGSASFPSSAGAPGFPSTPGSAPFPHAVSEPLFNAPKPILPLLGKYVITSLKSGMLIIHRQRAWERIFYEELRATLSAAGPAADSSSGSPAGSSHSGASAGSSPVGTSSGSPASSSTAGSSPADLTAGPSAGLAADTAAIPTADPATGPAAYTPAGPSSGATLAVPSHALLFPVDIPLPPTEAILMAHYRQTLTQVGFAYTFAYDNNTVTITAVPDGSLADPNTLHDTLLELFTLFEETGTGSLGSATPDGPTTSDGSSPSDTLPLGTSGSSPTGSIPTSSTPTGSTPSNPLGAAHQDPLGISHRDALAYLMAHKKAAQREPETPLELQYLIDRLFGCEQPAVTPTGKPCYTILTTEQLDQFLK